MGLGKKETNQFLPKEEVLKPGPGVFHYENFSIKSNTKSNFRAPFLVSRANHEKFEGICHKGMEKHYYLS